MPVPHIPAGRVDSLFRLPARIAGTGRTAGTARPTVSLGLALGIGAMVGIAPSNAVSHEVKAVVSIKPVHSLVSSIMQGVGEPGLIIDGAGSPHTYSLKPSQAADLAKADIVFWVGHELEAFLEKPIETIAAKANAIELIDSGDLTKRPFREGGPFDDHGHDDHAAAKEDEHDHDKHGDHEKHDDHENHADHEKHDHEKHADHEKHDHEKHADHEKHDHEKHADHEKHDHEKHADHEKHDHEKHADHEKHDHEKHADHEKHDDHEKHADHKKHGDHDEHAGHDKHGHEGHAHGAFDPHVWLDPRNAAAMAREIEKALSAADPDHAKTYRANLETVLGRLDSLETEVRSMLEPVKGKGFIVFHDAYQYFEARFGLNAAGSITVNPDVMPGAERIHEIHDKVRDLGATCVFAEPQFEPKLISVVMEGTGAKSGTLDPLGAGLEAGPDLYFELIREMAKSIRTCLGEAS